MWDHPEDLSLAFTATCQDGQPLTGLRKCADLKIGDTVSTLYFIKSCLCLFQKGLKWITVDPVSQSAT